MGTGDNVDLGGGMSDMGPSAALTPAIWEKTIPYDGESFHLEYMDLEEFLLENGIPTSPEEDALKSSPEGNATKTEKVKVTTSAQTKITKSVSLLPIQELDKCEEEEEVVIITKSDSDVTSDVITGEWEDQTLGLHLHFLKTGNHMCQLPRNTFFFFRLSGAIASAISGHAEKVTLV